MYRAIWMAGYLLLMVAPCARAVTINITESAPDLITFNTGGSSLNVTKKAGDLGNVLPGGLGWTIDTSKDLATADQFTFGPQTIGPVFYFQEPNALFLNELIVQNDQHTISVVSDFAWTGSQSPPFATNNTSQRIGRDTRGNDVFVVFNDTLTPDPTDTPEPASLFLVGSGVLIGSGVLMAIQRARCLT